MNITNPYRNGILKVFDDLAHDMGRHGFKHELARTTLKSALRNCTELQAFTYLNKLNKSCSDILCLTKIQN